MPITAADIAAATAAGLTRSVTYSVADPTGGADGDWWIPGPPTAPGIYRRIAGAWVRVALIRTADESARLLETLTLDDRLDASAIKNLPAPTGWATQGTQSLTFANANWLAHGATIPAAATVIQVAVQGPAAVRGTYLCNAAIHRLLTVSAPGAAPTAAARAPLTHLGLLGSLWIGRSNPDGVLLAYDGGHAGLASGAVEVLTH